jgi:SWI/SNF-related matrix-associated actin-dependent regulator of chromatin subfamily A3
MNMDTTEQAIDLTGETLRGNKLDEEVNRRLAVARHRLSGRLISPHQTDGVRFLIKREIGSIIQGGVLADEMGLGKTVQIIALILSDENAKEPTLVVCDKSLIKQWESEIKKYAPQLKAQILYKRDMEILGQFFIAGMGGNTVIITSYGALNRNSVCQKVMWRRIILDEAHRIKNHRSLVFNNASALQAKSRWCITGTPILKNRSDMVSLLRFCRLYTADAVSVGESELRQSASSYVLRRTFDDLCKVNTRLALPPLNIRTHMVDLTDEEKRLYNDLIKAGKFAVAARDQTIDSDEARSINNYILRILMRLQQTVVSPDIISKEVKKGLFDEDPDFTEVDKDKCSICLDPLNIETCCRTGCNHCFCEGCLLYVFDKMPRDEDGLTHCPLCKQFVLPAEVVRPKGKGVNTESLVSSKMNKLGEILDTEIRRDKALIFTHWKAESALIETICKERGISVASIHGGLSSEQRDDIVKTFQGDSNTSNPIQVIIIQIHCGACGLNLTEAKHIIFPSLDWTPSNHMQAIARAHRIGQTNRVSVHYVVASDTIDQHVLAKQFAKLKEASMILDDQRIELKMGDVVTNRCDMFDILKLLN